MLEILATSLSVVGSIFVAYRKRVGFLIWIVANTLWVSFALLNQHWGMALLFCVHFITSFIGYKKRG